MSKKIEGRGSCAVLFVQCAPSQLDSVFYSELSQNTSGRIALALMHDGNAQRTQADPELGLVPQFPPMDDGHRIFHLPSERRGGLSNLIALIFNLRPHMVVVQDQAWKSKVTISFACRIAGVRVVMRSDKNDFSSTPRKGLIRFIEVLMVKALFDGIAPVSELTLAYYHWSESKSVWWFPYPTLKSKFSRCKESIKVRQEIRNKFRISETDKVVLAVTKFVERENPLGVIQAFNELQRKRSDVSLLLVGSGPMEAQLKSAAESL